MELGDQVYVKKTRQAGTIVAKKGKEFTVFTSCDYIICKEDELRLLGMNESKRQEVKYYG